MKATSPEIIRSGSVMLEELPQTNWLTSLFTRENVESGDATRIASDIVKRRDAVAHLRNNRDAIAEGVADIVTRAPDGPVRNRSVDAIVAFIEEITQSLDPDKVSSE